jgi:uncharacterized membrane protein
MRKLLVAAVAAMVLSHIPAKAAHYITVDVGGYGDTGLLAINAKGQIAGYANGNGFLRETDGTIVPLQVAGYTNSVPWAINDRGDVVGSASYSCNGGFSCEVSFLRFADGTVTTFSASSTPGNSTTAKAINAKGQIAGYYADPGGLPHGFIRQRDGKIRTVDVPGAQSVILYAINDEGYAAGLFQDTATHGLLVAPDGTQTVINVPGAHDTLVNGLNDDGTIVGSSFYDGGSQAAYLRAADGTITTIDGAFISEANAIDRSGNVVGYYQPENRGFAFLRRPSGELVTLKIKDSYSEATSVNDGGTVVGYYQTKGDHNTGKMYGFIWQP